MSEERTFVDVAIVGAGACGLSAAVTAAEGGATVAVFEKQRSLGGSSNFFEGTFAVESELQRKAYIAYSRDEAFRALMEYSHWRADARIVRAYVEESAPTIAWLQRQGVEFLNVSGLMADAPWTYHVVKGAGEAVVKRLASSAKRLGVEVRPGAAGRRLLKEGGRISGIVVEEEGVETTIECRAAIIATGGYTNNRAWIKKYAGLDLDVNLFPLGNVEKTGDGIRMAWEAGAAEEGMGLVEMYRIGPMGPDFPMLSHLQVAAVQPDLWVDCRGQRFCNEGIAFNDTAAGNVSARGAQEYTFTILDDSIKERMITEGIERNMSQLYPPGTRPVNFDRDMDAALRAGSPEVCAADSVAKLAGQMGTDAGILAATVAEYNVFCERGHDDLFAKNARYLRPLRGPRFYAIKCRTISLGTLGGIKINHRMEALDRKEKAISGLYAGGMDAGGMWGDSYPIREGSGTSSAFAINSGRIAGRNALRYIGK